MIRARLFELWPVLSAEFGLMPWDIRRLSHREVAAYEHAARHMIAEAKRKR